MLFGGLSFMPDQKLYVGNLNFHCGDSELTELFSKVGKVSKANVIFDKESGRSKGFGFVEMSSEDAEKAIETYNGFSFEGRNLIVNVARPLEAKGNRSYGGGGGGGGGRGGYGGGGGGGRGGY